MSKREIPSWYRESPPKQIPFVFEPEEEDDVAILPQVDNSALLARLQLSLVGQMLHQGRRNMEALVSFLSKEHIWDVEGRVWGVSLGDSRFQFFFESEADLQKFWEEEALRNLGSSRGVVRRVDPTKGRIEISVKTDVPLKFNKNAQLPTRAVVKVKLFYEKLLRWCSYSGRIYHEFDLCPLINVNQRAALAAEEKQKNPRYLTKGDGRNQYLSLPHDFSVATRNGHGRKNLPLSAVSKHHQSFAVASLRRPSSRYDPKGNGTDAGRKRRHEDSFSQEKSYEPSSKGRKGPPPNDPAPTHLPSKSFCGKQPLPHLSDSQWKLLDTLIAPLRAKLETSSRHMSRNNPFVKISLRSRLPFSSPSVAPPSHEAAYHAMEPPIATETDDLEEDDLLGKELQDSLQNRQNPLPQVSPDLVQKQSPPEKRKSMVGSSGSQELGDDLLG
ncbi:unnamed protein product [Arabidopsis arenosa]|uniref:Zinc knuckle CX2CX4HX4C domain-containing protein n=1 Tax=Arabidopsis arenosa TaxID=38785 RepID=A0A8S1ZXU6_ARAAE|nr:unnamed protein product [Arabidopsis arenosa]